MTLRPPIIMMIRNILPLSCTVPQKTLFWFFLLVKLLRTLVLSKYSMWSLQNTVNEQ